MLISLIIIILFLSPLLKDFFQKKMSILLIKSSLFYIIFKKIKK